jgi:hypothetical protein
MAKFYGAVGYNHGTVEQKPGVFVESIVEKQYYGDILRNTRQLREGESVNNDLTVGNSVSIVADAYANEHFHAIRFVDWAGSLWDVQDVTVQAPRLVLRLGGVYNGRRADNDEGSG